VRIERFAASGKHMVMNAETLAPHSTRPSPAVPALDANEPRAPIAVLTPAQRKALLVCLDAGTIRRHAGAWIPATCSASEPRISGITVADLARDGLLTIEASGKSRSARLTMRGSWFARTVATSL
jgi:hypothetical protein